jgi:serine O-acetyltransferase
MADASGEITSELPLVRQLREIRQTNRGSWLTPSCQAVSVHAITNWARRQPAPIGLPVRALCRALFLFVRNVYGIELPTPVTLGRRFRLNHQGMIVIHPHTVFGDDCIVRQGVTIGGARVGHGHAVDFNEDHPTFGDRVDVGAGAVVVGRVHVGDDVKIGPNAVVTSNVPAGSIVVAPASRVISMRRRAEPRDAGESPG